MFPLIYVEEALRNHPTVDRICRTYPHTPLVFCHNYAEVFHPKAQNFRAQKQKPSLILAHRQKHWLIPVPPHHTLGGSHHFYFSHILNCPYDCRYCFLQGMFSSANYVFFINYEDCHRAMEDMLDLYPEGECYFFSGYDGDSLALDSITQFVDAFVPFFVNRPRAFLELRTKSHKIDTLLHHEPSSQIIVAFSLTPEWATRSLEHRTPSLSHRLIAMQKTAKARWPIGLRFDPLLYTEDYQQQYKALFSKVFAHIEPTQVHSVTLGPLRFPKEIAHNITALYPEEKLFSQRLQVRQTMVSYSQQIEEAMMTFCHEELLRYVPASLLFSCKVPS